MGRRETLTAVSYTHLDVYKRQFTFMLRYYLQFSFRAISIFIFPPPAGDIAWQFADIMELYNKEKILWKSLQKVHLVWVISVRIKQWLVIFQSSYTPDSAVILHKHVWDWCYNYFIFYGLVWDPSVVLLPIFSLFKTVL